MFLWNWFDYLWHCNKPHQNLKVYINLLCLVLCVCVCVLAGPFLLEVSLGSCSHMVEETGVSEGLTELDITK